MVFDLIYILPIEPKTTLPPVTVEEQPPTRHVTQQAINYSMPATLPGAGIYSILFVRVY